MGGTIRKSIRTFIISLIRYSALTRSSRPIRPVDRPIPTWGGLRCRPDTIYRLTTWIDQEDPVNHWKKKRLARSDARGVQMEGGHGALYGKEPRSALRESWIGRLLPHHVPDLYRQFRVSQRRERAAEYHYNPRCT